MGNRDNRPLSPRRAAELMRDVDADEIPSLVDELNRRYDEPAAPYQIVGEGDGYRLTLRREFHRCATVSTAASARPGCRRPPSTCWRWWRISSR